MSRSVDPGQSNSYMEITPVVKAKIKEVLKEADDHDQEFQIFKSIFVAKVGSEAAENVLENRGDKPYMNVEIDGVDYLIYSKSQSPT